MADRKIMEQKPSKAVLAAIAAAVTNYIQAEPEACLPRTDAIAGVPALSATPGLYGASGRQQMMEMRRLLCLRMGRR